MELPSDHPVYFIQLQPQIIQGSSGSLVSMV